MIFSTLFKKKPRIVESLRVNAELCTGCAECVERCKRDVFGIDKKSGKATVIALANCVGCGKCVKKMCRFNAIELVVR